MNAKKAKQLRRLAESLTVGIPTLSYGLSHSHRQIVVNPESTKGVYHRLKRAAKGNP